MFNATTDVILCSSLIDSVVGHADDDSDAKRIERFQKQVWPVLKRFYSKYHGADAQATGLPNQL